jgi:hypothetical protein
VLRTRANRRSFGRPIAVAPGPALDFTLSLSGRGQGLAGWVGGSCTADPAAGDVPGPVFASFLRDGAFQGPLTLSPAGTAAYGAATVGDPHAGGGIVSWLAYPQQAVFSIVLTRTGILEPARQITDAVVPVAVTGGGDQVFTRPFFIPPARPPVLFVRPSGGGADEHAPVPSGEHAVAAPTGRRVALAWGTGRRLNVSVWRP